MRMFIVLLTGSIIDLALIIGTTGSCVTVTTQFYGTIFWSTFVIACIMDIAEFIKKMKSK